MPFLKSLTLFCHCIFSKLHFCFVPRPNVGHSPLAVERFLLHHQGVFTGSVTNLVPLPLDLPTLHTPLAKAPVTNLATFF